MAESNEHHQMKLELILDFKYTLSTHKPPKTIKTNRPSCCARGKVISLLLCLFYPIAKMYFKKIDKK